MLVRQCNAAREQSGVWAGVLCILLGWHGSEHGHMVRSPEESAGSI